MNTGRILAAAAMAAAISCSTSRKAANNSVPEADTQKQGTEIQAVPTSTQEADPFKVSEDAGKFTVKLFVGAAALQGDKSQNLVLSPYSAGVALSMLRDGAAGETASELSSLLGAADYSKAPEVSEDMILQSANSAWLKKGFEIRSDYAKTLSDKYGALIACRDFSASSTVSEINAWCSEHTAGRIPTIVDKIKPSMVMFLMNALYFKAPWENAFDKAATTRKDFHSPSGEVKVEFMRKSDKFLYADIYGNQVIALPYKGGKYAMVVALPSQSFTADDLIPYLREFSPRMVMNELRRVKVNLELPKFKVETTQQLEPVLEALGVSRAFTAAADFSGMTPESVAVDEVKQKCFIEVNEEGAEAAAVTSVGIRLTSVRPDMEQVVNMKVDRPFVFAIVDMEETDILFVGKISEINQ